MSAREEYIKGLRDLADWLEANPAAPLERFDQASMQHSINNHVRDRAEAIRRLDEAAVALGLDCGPLASHGGDARFYGFEVSFGPVRYLAVSIADEQDEDGAR
ncbi:hypothetical protein OHR68_09735 [Spirillospora sp. NBC_00431]